MNFVSRMHDNLAHATTISVRGQTVICQGQQTNERHLETVCWKFCSVKWSVVCVFILCLFV